MAVDMFLQMEDVNGESHDANHNGEIDILSWRWGMSRTGTTHPGKFAGVGKVSVQDISFTHNIDASTPILMQLCSTGRRVHEVVLTVRKAGGAKLEYLVITMKNAVVTSVSMDDPMGVELLTENFTLNFEEYTISYTPQRSDGSGDAAVEWGYNIATNQPV